MQGVQLAHDYSVLLGMPKTQSEVTIHMYGDTEKLASAYARETTSLVMESARTGLGFFCCSSFKGPDICECI